MERKAGPSIDRKNSKQDYATPWDLIYACEKRFGVIGVDLAATHENKKAPVYFSKSSLKASWSGLLGVCWLNPPFSNIKPWAKKCYEESLCGATRILLLTPASIGANWFRDHIHGKALVLALNGRITFVGATDPYPKDCIISAFGFNEIGFDVWDWKDNSIQTSKMEMRFESDLPNSERKMAIC